MGHAGAMTIAREVAVECSDVVISNADEYNFLYVQAPLDKKAHLQMFNGAYGGVTGLAAKFQPNHEANTLDWITIGRWGVTRKNLDMMQGALIATLKDDFRGQLANDHNHFKPVQPGAKIRFGKCFICAGIAARELLRKPAFPPLGLSIEICKTAGVKHYFVVVGRGNKPGGNAPDPATINNHAQWGANAFIVDIWQGNLNQDYPLWGRQTDAAFHTPSVVEPADWAYIADAGRNQITVVAQMTTPFVAELEAAND